MMGRFRTYRVSFCLRVVPQIQKALNTLSHHVFPVITLYVLIGLFPHAAMAQSFVCDISEGVRKDLFSDHLYFVAEKKNRKVKVLDRITYESVGSEVTVSFHYNSADRINFSWVTNSLELDELGFFWKDITPLQFVDGALRYRASFNFATNRVRIRATGMGLTQIYLGSGECKENMFEFDDVINSFE